jgi:hypothetical protein
MSRSTAVRRWVVSAVVAGVVGIGAGGCVVLPVGGYGPEPGLVVPAPGVVVAPPPVIIGPGYRRGYHRHYYGGHRGYWRRG